VAIGSSTNGVTSGGQKFYGVKSFTERCVN